MKKYIKFGASVNLWGLFVTMMLVMNGCTGCGNRPDSHPIISICKPAGAPIIANVSNHCAIRPPYWEPHFQSVILDFAQINGLHVCDTANIVLMGDSVSYVVARRDTEVLFSVIKLEEVGDPSGNTTLVYRGAKENWDATGVVIGDLLHDGVSYELRKCNAGYVLGKVNEDSLKAFDGMPHTDPFPTESPSQGNCQIATGNGVIDLMILYTDSAREAAGGVAEVEAEILLAMTKANEVFVKNKMKARLHLAFIGEYGNYPLDLESTTNDMQAKLGLVVDEPSMDTKADDFSADLVLVFVKNGNTDQNGYASNVKRKAVLKVGMAPQNYLLAHEIGHLLRGDGHDDACSWVEGTNRVQGIWTNKNGYTRTPVPQAPPCSTQYLTEIEAGAQRASTNRCPNLVHEALIQDFFQDDGLSANTTYPNSALLMSPHIYVRDTRDTNLMHLYQAENLDPDKDNYLYVMVRNGSNQIIEGSLSGYVYSQTLTPVLSDLQCVGTIKHILIPPASIKVLEIKIPQSQSSNLAGCGLLAQWHTALDTVRLAGTDAVLNLVRESYRVAARAAMICTLSSPNPPKVIQKRMAAAPSGAYSTVIKFKKEWGDQLRFRFMPSAETGRNFKMDDGSWTFKYAEELTDSGGVKYNESGAGSGWSFIPFDTNTIPHDPGGDSRLYLNFYTPERPQNATYPVHLELLKEGQVVGAYTYILKTANLPQP